MSREIKRSGKVLGFEGEKSDEYDTADNMLIEGLEAVYRTLIQKNKNALTCDANAPSTLAKMSAMRKKLDDMTDSEVGRMLKKEADKAIKTLKETCGWSR